MADNNDLVRLLVTVVAVALVVPILMMAVAWPMMGMWGGGHMGSGMWGDGTMPGWMFILGIVIQLLFLAAILGGGYLIYRTVVGSENDSDRVLEELRLAYARGELTDEEYEQRREALESDTE